MSNWRFVALLCVLIVGLVALSMLMYTQSHNAPPRMVPLKGGVKNPEPATKTSKPVAEPGMPSSGRPDKR